MEEKKSSLESEKAYKYAKTKKRYWTFVLYPESAPSDWRDQLQATGLQIAISPLHDKDINPGTGETKKAHYHIILCYEGPTTGSAVKRLVDDLGQPIPLPIDSVRGLYRYFTHKDNPEKHQYFEADITTINGFSISNFSDLSSGEISKVKLELVKFIRETGLVEYSDFIDCVMDLEKPDYFLIASTNTLFFDSYLRSRRHSITQGKSVVICDKETGEVVAEVDKRNISLEP
jgi:hypothetical protein